MGFRESLSRAGRLAVEELQRASGSPNARSVDRFPGLATKRGTVARSGEVDKHYPDRKNIQEYWRLYQEIPIIRQPIRSFASEVVEPGYYIDAENEDLKEDMEDWLQSSCIVDGEVDKDFSLLLKKATIQREVKGTSMCEKVPNDEGGLYGFKLMRPETVRAFTKPGQTVLVPPDYDIDDHLNQNGLIDRLLKNQTFYTTDDGEVAAYVQVDDAITGTKDGYYIPFTRDNIIKLTRDADVGEVFGESRIAAVENRLQALLKKLRDNDKAIESLAHPFQLFQFGSEEDPWNPEEIQDFMNQHSQDQFEPGMKQGVQGDMSIETVSGEVAPIESFLDFDINWIISEMPMPRYALGGFESEVNQFVSRSQETRLENQINEAREEIQNEWTPVIEDKVEEMGYDVEEFNGFYIGEDPASLNLVEETKKQNKDGNVPNGNNSDEENVGAGGTSFERPPASSEDDRVDDENQLYDKLANLEDKIETMEKKE